MNLEKKTSYLNVNVIVYSETLDIKWEYINFSIHIHNKLDFEGIHESFISRIKQISVEKNVSIDENKFFIFVLGRRLSDIDNKKITIEEVLEGLKELGICMFMERNERDY